jgi:ATP-binding cassette subfamily F protein uup
LQSRLGKAHTNIEEVALLLSARDLSKSYGADPPFRNLNLNISEGERIGIIGPNGSGKSTLLQLVSGRQQPDSGEVALRKNTRLAYVAQDSQFAEGVTVRGVIRRALDAAAVREEEKDNREAETLGRAGFVDFDVAAATLSGGWRKRLALAEALVADPDILLLDEPTNHLDLAGIDWLEKLLQSARFACLVVSHDRYFLENVATDVAEINRVYPEGILRVHGNYSSFLEKKSEFLAAQAKRQDALENRVRTEMAWLRRGPKARATKAKARIDNAQALIGELADLNTRSRAATADIDFTASDRKTKRLIEVTALRYAYGERVLFDNVEFVLTAGTRIGLVGPNGSGKTTLLRLLRGEIKPLSGEVRQAQALRVVYFDQNRPLNEDLTLRQALAAGGDSVIYRERVIHVAAWASRFLFTNEQLNQPVSRLSGGERARVLIANLMLEPADVLLLDEPTNDLDIPTLEILEESLADFPGSLVLVTHDRYLLDRVSTTVIGLDGEGKAELFADYAQWQAWIAQKTKAKPNTNVAATSKYAAPANKKKLSYMENREFEGMEERIAVAERTHGQWRGMLENQEVLRDPKRLAECYAKMESARSDIDSLYARWVELEEKIG